MYVINWVCPGLCLDTWEGPSVSPGSLPALGSVKPCQPMGCIARNQVLWVDGSETLPSALVAQLDSKNSAQFLFLT